MGVKRKKYLIDRKFQLTLSIKAVVLPLIITVIIGSVLLYFAKKNNNFIKTIVKNQEQLIDMFLTTPALYNLDNPVIKNGEGTFKENIGMLVSIQWNSYIVLLFIIGMIVIQSVIIFSIYILFTHRISGPLYVMTQYLQEIKKGKIPNVRPLRDKDELKNFYTELNGTIEYLIPILGEYHNKNNTS